MLSGRSPPDAFAVLPTQDVERGSDEGDERELEPTSGWNEWPADDDRWSLLAAHTLQAAACDRYVTYNSESGRGDWIRTSDPLRPRATSCDYPHFLQDRTSKWLIHRWIWRYDPLSSRVSDGKDVPS